jgi:hypothetical protein
MRGLQGQFPPLQSTHDNVIPLIGVLHPEAIAQIPDWAIGTNLYFDPKLGWA